MFNSTMKVHQTKIQEKTKMQKTIINEQNLYDLKIYEIRLFVQQDEITTKQPLVDSNYIYHRDRP